MKWDQPFCLQAFMDALQHASRSGKMVQPGRQVYGVVINHSSALQDSVVNIVDLHKRLDVGNKSFALRHHCYNGKPEGWWSIAFLWTEEIR